MTENKYISKAHVKRLLELEARNEEKFERTKTSKKRSKSRRKGRKKNTFDQEVFDSDVSIFM